VVDRVVNQGLQSAPASHGMGDLAGDRSAFLRRRR
jgi:hypothetical protein